MWSALFLGDESYARNSWYYALLDGFRDYCERGNNPHRSYMDILMGTNSFRDIEKKFELEDKARGYINGGIAQLEFPNAFLLPQGRCCENILFSILKHYWAKERNVMVISNGLFDTTKANVAVNGFEGINLFMPDIFADFEISKIDTYNSFRGNINIAEFKNILATDNKRVALINLTMTNNTGAGQPVSLANVRETKKLCNKYNIPLWIDASRIAENAAFIKRYEREYKDASIPEILKLIFEEADGFHTSLKKALCNMGGFMCFKHKGLFDLRYPGIGNEMKKLQVLTYGNDSYGALSGRDIAAATLSLYESISEEYLYPRIELTKYLAIGLANKDIPVILPPGGHAVYIDLNKMFPSRPWNDFIGLGLCTELLKRYGIRSCELGYFAWEIDRYLDKHGKLPERMPPNLLRLAIPANVYHKDHMDYVIESLDELNRDKKSIPAFEITRGKDNELRHFIAGVKPKI